MEGVLSLMVDFNSEATVGTPASDVERISILQRRYDLIEAFEDYKKRRSLGTDHPLSIVRVRLMSLFIELQALLKRRLSTKDYNDLKDRCFDIKSTEENIIKSIFELNEQLDAIRLTMIDTQVVYNKRKVEEENKIKGY